MTSSGICHICMKIATNFYYRRPLKEAGFHDGFWHCEDHGPTSTKTNSAGEKVPTDAEFRPRMSRAERRKLERKMRK